MGIERVLLLDDNTSNTLFFEMLLKDMGMKEVVSSPTGDDALILADKKHVQFVICSWELAGMPGTIFIQKLRAKKRRKYIPCIIYSKRMEEQEVRLTQELGFKNILSMPFEKDKAIAMINEIIEHENNIDPKEVAIRKIEMYLQDGKPGEAFKMFNDDLFKPGPFRSPALVAAGEVFMALSKYDKAEKCADDVLERIPDNYRALQLKAKLHSRRGEHDQAINILKKLMNQSPKNLTTRVNLGAAYVAADRFDEAKQVFNDVLDIDPENQAAKDQMATVVFQEGDFGLAEQLIAETENGNELARIFNNIAISQVAEDSFDEAIQTYENAIRLLADKTRLYLLQYNLGLAYRKKGDLNKGLETLATSYFDNLEFEKAYVAIARIYKEMKKKGLTPDASIINEVKKKRATSKSA
ncbi:tetratricopeptide repeat protein [Pseudobacteriovorax antillogorgiicola]|uniref:Tetratricopeptide repeat-containing protein n=1 Tax=Pseudobacteriovorax antillogorgiicola TaxID=1513793 RepID=A0A1Y6CIH3_9BACT|nr:tetratricopeptide repeat protein [Pseudobacteriovorax antillogorgiicola]TCS46648.1 tetratricopeptide repeat protein [Pseudobacteriovorax antillogorgiicola]SMF66362.1 Tetratricopeptide repeat-containing protein [Pseudobacteriovorax antillogorgiicola]